MTVTIDRAPSLDILEGLAQEMDPSEERIRLGRDRYEDLGDWLKQYAGRTAQRDVEVYPQGSFNLGTTNQDPLSHEFDIDLVIRVDYAKTEISQRELNQQLNGWLGSYVSVRQGEGGILAPTGLEKGKRAWTLQYDDAFHMDILPVVPAFGDELPARSGDPSWLTDKALVNWQPTNPKGFANWFRGLAAIEWRIVAKRADIQVDPLPEHGARTALQMAVKIIKRHRDHYFADDPENLAPPSALLSALAALAYERYAREGNSLKIVLPAWKTCRTTSGAGTGNCGSPTQPARMRTMPIDMPETGKRRMPSGGGSTACERISASSPGRMDCTSWPSRSMRSSARAWVLE
jgi:hypothetical protein